MSGIAVADLAVGELTFRCRSAGPLDGPLVLLLHGFPQTSAVWTSTLSALAAKGHRAVAPDLRGYSPGARPVEIPAYEIGPLVQDVLDIADALGAPEFDLVGHDWGGVIAWQVAGAAPGRLRSLAVVSTPHPTAFGAALRGELGGDQAARSGYAALFEEPGVAEDFLLADGAAALRGIFAGLPAEHVEDYVATLSEREALTAVLSYYRATRFDEQPPVGSIAVPTLYVWSTGDAYLGPEAAHATPSHVSGPFRYAELADVPHWVPELGADEFEPILIEHLASFS
jgi:pimeloyl-ACP methyl ester carboxylesterase